MRRQLPLPWPAEANGPAGFAATAAPDGCSIDAPPAPTGSAVDPAPLPVFVRNGRARRYILRVLPDARVRVTIPRYGSRREAEAFLQTRLEWIADRRRELRMVRVDRRWLAGTRVWWRGVLESVTVVGTEAGRGRPGGARASVSADAAARRAVTVRCADVSVLTAPADDYRGVLERAMRRVAAIELPRQLLALAARHGLAVAAVSVRNQRSRWGSCSRDGRIALNWRLLQMPDAVREYVLLHELMHLREHNHSPRFWALVEGVCPGHLDARRWLRHDGLTLC